MWLSIVKALLSLADGLMSWLNRRQLISAGENKVVAEQLGRTLDNVDEARRAADAADNDPAYRDELRDFYENEGR